jgi:hypothetical protein
MAALQSHHINKNIMIVTAPFRIYLTNEHKSYTLVAHPLCISDIHSSASPSDVVVLVSAMLVRAPSDLPSLI